MKNKYSKADIVAFGLLVNALGGSGDLGQSFPKSDAEDLSRGARFVPGEVTIARRNGEHVTFVTDGGWREWYWQLPNGDRISHA